MKCKICGKEFVLFRDNKKIVLSSNNIFNQNMLYEAFDCPHCGCQNIVNQYREEEKTLEAKTDETYKNREKMDYINKTDLVKKIIDTPTKCINGKHFATTGDYNLCLTTIAERQNEILDIIAGLQTLPVYR
jgi:DNA-directed RNA polymerase subunit RPC12/RpoP